jgi:hypothetical protein
MVFLLIYKISCLITFFNINYFVVIWIIQKYLFTFVSTFNT